MRRAPASLPSLLPYRVALRLLARLLPPAARAEWIAEWSAELWYVRDALPRDSVSRSGAHRQLVRFARGALTDARGLRHRDRSPARSLSRSPLSCLLALLILLVSFASLADLLPGVRHVLRLSALRHDDGVVSISIRRSSDLSEEPPRAISLRTFRAWQRRSQHLFREFAFFSPRRRSVHIGAGHSPELVIAYSSANVLALLGVDIPAAGPDLAAPTDPLPRLFLSESAWKTYFGSRKDMLGEVIKVGLQPARLAGILPDEANPTPGRIDVWLLLPKALADTLPDSTEVVLLARPAPPSSYGGFSYPDQPWSMSVPEPGGAAEYTCVPLSAQAPPLVPTFLFVLCLGVLCLPATNFPFAGEGSPSRVGLPVSVALRRGLFFAAKLALLLPAGYFATLDLAFGLPWANPHTPQYLQLVFGFLGSLAALHWTLRDQGQRCPVCLDRLRCPARVGQPSRNFLTWNGTELICVGGHGFLHVPELPTSWFSRPRWLHLDPSWSGLFPLTP